MRLASVWSDMYASTLALYTGRAGGHRWLVAAPPPYAGTAAAALAGLNAKGEVILLAHAGLTPLGAALGRQQDPVLGRGLAGVLIVDRELAGGRAVRSAFSQEQAGPGGLSYRDGGHFPAWQDALGASGMRGECPAAGVCAGLGLPVRVCAPEHISPTLLEWWATVPHALAASDGFRDVP